MDMREEAERSCSLVEHAEVADTREGFAAEVAESLVGVLAAGLRLPPVEPTERELPHLPSDDEWRDRFVAVQRLLGDWDDYWAPLALGAARHGGPPGPARPSREPQRRGLSPQGVPPARIGARH